MEHEQLRLTPALLGTLRGGVSHAVERGAQFVAPPHLLLALLDDATVGPVLGELVSRERVETSAEAALTKLPEVMEVPEGPLPDGEKAPFPRYDTLAFRSTGEARTLYLDRDAYEIFLEGARRADESYDPKHLAMGFIAVSVRDLDVLTMIGPDVQAVTRAVHGLQPAG